MIIWTVHILRFIQYIIPVKNQVDRISESMRSENWDYKLFFNKQFSEHILYDIRSIWFFTGMIYWINLKILTVRIIKTGPQSGPEGPSKEGMKEGVQGGDLDSLSLPFVITITKKLLANKLEFMKHMFCMHIFMIKIVRYP